MASKAIPAPNKSTYTRRRPAPTRWVQYSNSYLAREISNITRYYDCLIQWLPRDEDSGLLLEQIEAKSKLRLKKEAAFPTLTGEGETRTAVLVNGTFNHHSDVQGLLTDLKARLCRASRLIVVLYNPYFRALYRLANRVGLRKGDVPTTFLRRVDIHNLAKLSGFEIVRQQPRLYCPLALLGIGEFINRLLPIIPFVRWLGFVNISVWRPIIAAEASGLSCVIPARNERGNIENALKRFPRLGCPVEIIFVEGHSTDGTWEEIKRVSEAYGHKFRIKVLRQTGSGKADAVRLGFANASEQLITVLDADLSMPPEMLTRFYEAYCRGLGDFINGSRLVYPMEGEAMRPLNRLGNIFFAKTLSWVLDTRVGDSLCGTKLLSRRDYSRFVAWRRDFGDFDPFGDFELLFPASTLALGVIDVPIRYLARTYGETNINRFRHGAQLLRMTSIGLYRIKLGFRRESAISSAEWR